MAAYLTVPGRTWPAQDAQVKEFFGRRPEDKWPKDGLTGREIQGIWCWVDPIKPGFNIRALCKCPQCGKVVPICRLKQHSKVHA